MTLRKATEDNCLFLEADYEAGTEPESWQALWKAVKPNIQTVPCLVIEVNGLARVMPFPADVDETLRTLKQYGGD